MPAQAISPPNNSRKSCETKKRSDVSGDACGSRVGRVDCAWGPGSAGSHVRVGLGSCCAVVLIFAVDCASQWCGKIR